MHNLLTLAIPLLALSIPLVALTGHYVIQPLVKVLGRLVELQDHQTDPEQEKRLADLQDRLEVMERVVAQLAEEQRFLSELHDVPARIAGKSTGSGTSHPA